MKRLLAFRTIGALGSILGASVASFVILRVLPGNPARLILGPFVPEQAVQNLIRQLGLTEPLPVQYVAYMRGFVTGDWGFSYSTGEPVRQLLLDRFPATLELALYAFIFAVVGAVSLALVSTYRRRRTATAIVGTISSIGLGTPPFWLGLVLLIVLTEAVGVFPGPEGRLSADVSAPNAITHLYTIDALLSGNLATFGDALRHLVLPAITLGLAPMAFLLRLLRANLLEASGETYLLVARSKGLGRWTTFVRHALPNALLPTLTASGLILGQLVAGSVLVEKVFNWPGVGELVTDSILRQDYSVVEAFILISASVYVSVNLIVDALYGFIDPRVRVAS